MLFIFTYWTYFKNTGYFISYIGTLTLNNLWLKERVKSFTSFDKTILSILGPDMLLRFPQIPVYFENFLPCPGCFSRRLQNS